MQRAAVFVALAACYAEAGLVTKSGYPVYSPTAAADTCGGVKCAPIDCKPPFKYVSTEKSGTCCPLCWANDIKVPEFLNKYNVLMVKILSKHELRRLCKTIGATPLPRLTAPSASEMGNCDVVAVEEIGDVRITAFRQVAESSALSTVVIRGATDNIMDDVQRAVDDGVNVFKQICRDPRFVPGAGATEIELALQLQQYAAEQPGLDQYAINAFGEALEEIPHALADNAGVKAKDVVACLYAAHTKGEATAGFDNTSDVPATVDAAAAGIWDGLSTKHWGIRYATTAANTVLRVDQIIMAKRAGGPKPGGGGPPGGDMSEYI